MRVSNQLRISKFEPSFSIVLDWCKKELVLANPEYVKKSRMGFWLGNTPKTISLYEIDGDDLVLPYGCLNNIFRLSPFIDVQMKFVEHDRIDYGCDIPLYDYQQDAVNALVESGKGILQSAAGSGKTQIGIATAVSLGCKTLWLCHTLDLVRQSKNRAEQYMSPSLTGTITEGRVQIGKAITFATVQAMCNLDLGR